MPTSAKTGACYTGQIGATVLAAVRTISGLPTRRDLYNFFLGFNFVTFIFIGFPKKIL
jgi:hypothetical protein